MREKLELILAGVEGRICNGCGNFDIEDSYEVMLDHLIANGVTVQKRGSYKVEEAEMLYGMVFGCDVCGEKCITLSDEYNFCPNCGADMRGE